MHFYVDQDEHMTQITYVHDKQKYDRTWRGGDVHADEQTCSGEDVHTNKQTWRGGDVHMNV